MHQIDGTPINLASNGPAAHPPVSPRRRREGPSRSRLQFGRTVLVVGACAAAFAIVSFFTSDPLLADDDCVDWHGEPRACTYMERFDECLESAVDAADQRA